jgi:hypothetical protein
VCHADSDEDGFFEAGIYKNLDVDAFTYPDPSQFLNGGSYAVGEYTGDDVEDLSRFIFEVMNGGMYVFCDQQCSEDTAAYMWLLRNGIPGPDTVATTSCPNPDEIHYGKRTLRLLTSYEYDNSLQALFGLALPADYSSSSKVGLDSPIALLPNHVNEPASETRLNNFDRNAIELADWAVSTSGALSFTCSEATACAQNFIDEFAYVAYRRPLTAAEKASYTDIITGAASLQSGLNWAVRTALMSPQFLYRSELGQKVSEALSNEPNPNATIEYVPAVPPVYVDAGGAVVPKYQRYAIDAADSGYQFTGDDLVLVTVTATSATENVYNPATNTTTAMTVWPTVQLAMNGPAFAPIPLTSAVQRTFTFRVTGVTGGQYSAIVNADSPPSGGTLNVIQVGYAPAKISDGPVEDTSKLEQADPNAYALDAYEYAAALAYMYTGSTPSISLLDAAGRGELFDSALLSAHIDNLMDSDLGREHVGRLAGIWFRTDKVTEVPRVNAPAFTDQVRESMAQEIREMYKYVFYENIPFTELYDGDFTMLDSTLASYYGLGGGGSGHLNFAYVDTTGTRRGGVIASGGFMAVNAHMDRTSPIQRSVHMRQDMLCQVIPLPVSLGDDMERAEAAAKVIALEDSGDLTDANFYDLQTNVGSCATCHNAIINPIFGIDDFNNVGILRDLVGGDVVQKGIGVNGKDNVPIDQVNNGGMLFSYDAVGNLPFAEADEAKRLGDGLAFSGGKDLGKVMVANNLPGLRTCLIEKSTRFALGYTLLGTDFTTNVESVATGGQADDLLCASEALTKAYSDNSQSPRAMMKALGMSDMVRFRR